MDNDIELFDDNCPKCGHFTCRRECSAIGCDEGYVDMYEYDDPLMFDPGDEEPCHECHGHGYFIWCPGCGYDLAADPEKLRQ